MDILQEISDAELIDLAELYKNETNAPYVYSYIKTAIEWKKKAPHKKYNTFYAVNGIWKTHGTFIALAEFFSYDIFVFSKEENNKEIYNALVKTKRFKFQENRTVFISIHRMHFPIVRKAVIDLKIKIAVESNCEIWWMHRQEALNLKVNIPNDLHVKELDKSHIPLVNKLWPHKYENSENYLMELSIMGKAYGLFRKENDEITAWIFVNYLGCLGNLQTLENHKRKGYASMLTLYLAKELAKKGFHPLGFVLHTNIPSRTMFEKCGFDVLNVVSFIESVKT